MEHVRHLSRSVGCVELQVDGDGLLKLLEHLDALCGFRPKFVVHMACGVANQTDKLFFPQLLSDLQNRTS